MILPPASALDRVVTSAIVGPQLVLRAGLLRTIVGLFKLLFLLAPSATIRFVWVRYLTSKRKQPPFVQQATAREDFAIRMMGAIGANLGVSLIRAATDRPAAAQILKWRAYRNGYNYSDHVEEKTLENGPVRTSVIFVTHNRDTRPDIIVYYVHGGGYVVLSAKFYVEFFLALKSTLLEAGFKNPAVVGLEYTLAPDHTYPAQLHEAVLGYKEALRSADSDTKVVVGGDSAGGMMTLTLLQELAARKQRSEAIRTPDLALLISPWVTLTTHLHKSTGVDYIHPEMLRKFAKLYTGGSMISQAPGSPGSCQDESIWRDACPKKGYIVTYGEDECLADDIRYFIKNQSMNGRPVKSLVDQGGVHVWPVVSMEVCHTNERRLKGLRSIANEISLLLD